MRNEIKSVSSLLSGQAHEDGHYPPATKANDLQS